MRGPDGTPRALALGRALVWAVLAPLTGVAVAGIGLVSGAPAFVAPRHVPLLAGLVALAAGMSWRAAGSRGRERLAFAAAALVAPLGAVVTLSGNHGTEGVALAARAGVGAVLLLAVVLSPGVRRSVDRALMLVLEGWVISVAPLLAVLLLIAASRPGDRLEPVPQPVVGLWVVVDVVVLSLLVGLLRRQPPGERSAVAPLVASIAAATAADTVTWRFGSGGPADVWADALWTTAVVAAAGAALGRGPLFWHPGPLRRRASDVQPSEEPPLARHEARTWLPVVVTGSVVCVVGTRAVTGPPTEPAVIGFTASLIAAVLIQTALLLREQSRLARRLHETSVRFRTIVDGSSDVVAVCDARGVVVFSSPAARAVLALEPGELEGRELTGLVHPAERHDLTEALSLGRQESVVVDRVRLTRAGGGWRHVEVRVHPHDTPAVPGGLTVVMRDVSERVRLQRELERRARYDALTGLPNRWWFGRALAHRVAEGLPTSVVFIDLDEFKAVNDTEGHAVGDRLLVAAARRLRFAVAEDDVVGRLSGDEFAVMVCDDDVERVRAVAEKVLEEMVTPYAVGTRRLRVTASLGLAVANGAAGADEVLRDADLAMYEAKRDGGRKVVVSHPRMLASAVERSELERRVREAAEGQDFELLHQPVVDLVDGRVVGTEALLRWPGSGVGPAVFVPSLERSGLIVEVGAHALDLALRQAARWAAAGRRLTVAVNLSPLQLADPLLTDRVRGALAAHGVPPDRLTLEVTETTLLRDLDAAAEVLEALRATGVRVALDDFGTGYSSLAHLHRLPLDVLKVDRAFVRAAAVSDRDQAVLRSIVQLGQELGLTVVAEGVQDVEQVHLLRALRCPLGQGFLLAQPTRPEDVPERVVVPPREPEREQAHRARLADDDGSAGPARLRPADIRDAVPHPETQGVGT
ncbi:putative bifunctional diguanylate cyclase/phosphodiesterase [Aquipuribacter sp. SD81]|uniref:putative bifunctional diguanylate cyclase/phosphodiesterase n=1 Tax=Aquipuribacter sp. SD81 TaxID=3127703 RepID=UPI003015D0F0